MIALGIIGILISFALLVYLCLRGVSILIAGPVCALLAVLISGSHLLLPMYTELFQTNLVEINYTLFGYRIASVNRYLVARCKVGHHRQWSYPTWLFCSMNASILVAALLPATAISFDLPPRMAGRPDICRSHIRA